tara:strand:+ start:2009 stop:2563 length:555 start_codon:yes stop_codon:yes gene_type:complete
LSNTSLSQTVNNSYSQALYELINEEKALDKVEQEAAAIIKLISDSPEFLDLIKDPRNTQSEQNDSISVICERYKINKTFIKFLKFLILKRRLFFLDKILKDFLIICSNKRGEIRAKITAPKELSKSEIENIENSLRDNFGSNLKLQFSYDPSLLGGLKLQVGSIMIDTSLKSKLQQIENKMIEA